jgi:lipoprotein-releasing system permease protein
MSLRFTAFAAFRQFRSGRRSGGVTAALFSVAGVTVGVAALTAVLGVMNGFQLGFIESILEVSSYHLQLELPGGERLEAEALERLRQLPGVRAVVPFAEAQLLAEGSHEPRGCLLRGLPADVAALDGGFAERVRMVDGEMDLGGPAQVVLGVELARYLGVGVGDAVGLLALGGGLDPERRTYLVSGLFRSGYYEFDLGWAFSRLAPHDPVRYGIKIRNRFRDREAAQEVRRALGAGDYRLESWREFNRAFFGALRMEKLTMMVLIGLIFVVVGFNIYHGLRRAVRERFEEIGVLKALGASEAAVRSVFLTEGLLIGLAGSALGLALGLVASANINGVFRAVEWLVNAAGALAARLAAPMGERFSLFSPAYFYLDTIPSRVLFPEAFLVVLFALGSCVAAARFAAEAVRNVKPMEVLRFE